MTLIETLKNHLKNSIGYKSNRKIIVLSVDDYGNVRIDSKRARENLNRIGLKIVSRYDAYDSLETTEDLDVLFEALSSVSDANGHSAILSAFSLPCNIDFEAVQANKFDRYIYEELPITFEKLSVSQPQAYNKTWNLWNDGMAAGIIVPQFHGREHLNVKIFNEKLFVRDFELLSALKNRSFTSLSGSGYSTISYTAAFDIDKYEDNFEFDKIIESGLESFQNVFGRKANHFNPPGGREHPYIHDALKKGGIKFIDAPLVKHEHQGGGKSKKVLNFSGKRNRLGQLFIVRNVVFEPTDRKDIDWVHYALKQIEAAFRLGRPAIISSHRVNFCGNIDTHNREIGIKALKELLIRAVTKWPDLEFMSADQLGEIILASK